MKSQTSPAKEVEIRSMKRRIHTDSASERSNSVAEKDRCFVYLISTRFYQHFTDTRIQVVDAAIGVTRYSGPEISNASRKLLLYTSVMC